MIAKAEKLLEEALKLPQEARAALAGKLILSLDDRIDHDAEAAWPGRSTVALPVWMRERPRASRGKRSKTRS